MTDDDMNRLHQLIDELASLPEIRELASPPAFEMTQNHYGHYMSVLHRLHREMPLGPADLSYPFHAAVLIKAGGNETGIRTALEVTT